MVGLMGLIIALVANASPANVNDLANRVPSGANMIAYINVKTLVNSKLGKQEDWKSKFTDAYAAGPMIVPPSATEVLLASWISPSTLEPVWEASIIKVATSMSMDRIARDEKGFTDVIGGKTAAWVPVNAYYVRLDDHMLGVLAPGDRQFASRWVDQSSAGGTLSPYLQSAAKSIDGKTDYLMAMDLRDAVSEKRVRIRLAMDEFECLSGKEIDAGAVGKCVASVKGLTLSVKVDDHAAGHCTIHFGDDVSPIASFAKPLLLEILNNAHAGIPDLEDWKVSGKGNSIIASGKLSNDGLRRLFSIIDPPSPGETGEVATASEAGSGDKGADKAAAAASKKYFQAVAKIVDTFGQNVRQSTSMTQGATFVSRSARRISRLPIVNVDPALVEWGGSTSMRLLDVASTLGGSGFKARARAEAVQDPHVSTGDSTDLEIKIDPNDAVERRNAARQRRAAAAEERAIALDQATAVLKEIEASRIQIRTAMTQKYKVEF